jgi:hypothetical protein
MNALKSTPIWDTQGRGEGGRAMRALIAGIADIARNRRDRDWDHLG